MDCPVCTRTGIYKSMNESIGELVSWCTEQVMTYTDKIIRQVYTVECTGLIILISVRISERVIGHADPKLVQSWSELGVAYS